jgi:hypothetical protein
MDMYTMTNDQINETMTLAMMATLEALESEGLLTEEQCTEFRDTHICLKVDKNSIWKWIREKCGFKNEDNVCYAVVFKKS